jgi:hypothetical protein
MRAATAAARDLEPDQSGKAFLKRTGEFISALAHVPDLPAADFSAVEIEQLSSTAETVIAAIERRIESGADKPLVQQDLAANIYEIRSRLEEITRWRKHFLQS